ncbi:hypothetical protein V1264_005617 [Littorina saxatilis]|uniref:Fucolectin tachylectin-4 pentraxin-1 domain-containing protein n=2 Tax=Littorina saxatilis TaxID=31220 RepID=A0AAN9B2G8_9CAEN
MQCSKTPSCVSFTYPGSLHTPGTCRGHSTRHFSVGDAQPTLRVSTYLMKEVEASNMAVHRPASQSSTRNHTATKANDGSFHNYATVNHSRRFQCTHTEAAAGERSWWQVDLEACYAILSVIITARADCCPERLHDFDVDVYDKDPEVYPGASFTRCYHYVGVMPAGVTEELVCDNKPIVGRVVRITDAPGEYLTLCEVQVMAVP